MKKIISFIKKIIPMGILFRVRYINQFLFPKKICTNSCGKKIYYVDAPHYANLGDQAIAMAIYQFAKEYFGDYEFVEICQDDFPRYAAELKREIKRDDIIFLTGGGNFGNIYYMYEATRRYIVSHFKENRVVIFPQTVEFTKDVFGKFSMLYSKRIYGNKKKVILCAREEKSYEIMKNMYENTCVLLIPDIAMLLSYSLDCKEKKNSFNKYIGICLRNDRERNITEQEYSLIINIIQKHKISIHKITTMSTVKYIDKNNREKLIDDKLKEISRSCILITDRLHAMIFGYITNTPCMVFDNSNRKVSGVYQWIKDNPGIRLIYSAKELNLNFENMKKKEEKLDLKQYYVMLSEYIKKR